MNTAPGDTKGEVRELENWKKGLKLCQKFRKAKKKEKHGASSSSLFLDYSVEIPQLSPVLVYFQWSTQSSLLQI